MWFNVQTDDSPWFIKVNLFKSGTKLLALVCGLSEIFYANSIKKLEKLLECDI